MRAILREQFFNVGSGHGPGYRIALHFIAAHGGRPTFAVGIRLPDGGMDEGTVLETDLLGAYSRSGNEYTIEIGIPMNPATGLQLIEGDSLGLQVEVIDFDTYPGWPHVPLFSCFVDLLLGDRPTGVTQAPPFGIHLAQNVPNPFNPSTRIQFELPRPERVQLHVFDMRGRLVRTLFDGPLSSGSHQVAWDGTNGDGRPQPSGVYVYRVTTGSHTQAQRMTLVR